MKITPDASLFQALSTFPRATRESITPAPGQSGDAASTRAKPDSLQDMQAREAARQEAIRLNRDAIDKMQQQLREREREQARYMAQPAETARTTATAQTAASSPVFQSAAGSVNPNYREAPGTEDRPRFQRLGQIIDISI